MTCESAPGFEWSPASAVDNTPTHVVSKKKARKGHERFSNIALSCQLSCMKGWLIGTGGASGNESSMK